MFMLRMMPILINWCWKSRVSDTYGRLKALMLAILTVSISGFLGWVQTYILKVDSANIFAFRMYLPRELSLYPLLLSSVFVPTSVLIHVSVPDNKGVPRAPISQGITLLDNSPEFPPKLDQTQLIPASPISFYNWTHDTAEAYFERQNVEQMITLTLNSVTVMA